MGTKKTTAAVMVNRLAKATPSEWTVEKGKGYHDGTQAWPDGGMVWVAFRRDGVTVVLNAVKATGEWEDAVEGLLVEGHTAFDGRCFTRRGVDTCSCRLTSKPSEWDEHAYVTLDTLLSGEYARCLAARARVATSVSVPGTPFRVQPEWFKKSAETLRSGRSVSLTPAGFGTGYTLTLVGRGRYQKEAEPELRRLLGLERVYVETFDHD